MPAPDKSTAESDQELSPNEIFISYSRRDKEFVVKLDHALRQIGHDPWVDWSDIQPAEDWWRAIERGIEAANIFVFVISPDSIASKVCRQEFEHALKHNKRLVPLLYREGFDMDNVHPSISRHNWIFCRDIDSFEQALEVLITAFKTDLGYVRAHTRLLIRAKEWQYKLSDPSFLLRGRDLLEAEEWLSWSNNKEPQPTELHHRYIHASRQDEQSRQEIELRLRRMTPQQYRNRQSLLSKVRNYWIEEVLEDSLHNRVLMELGLAERVDVVAPPWYVSATDLDSTARPLPKGTRALTLFDQLGEGRTLLILGEPGSGKTTTLLELTRDLLKRAEQGLDDRIPVVFNLSSWAGGKQPIDAWLVHELSTKYQIPPAIGQTWVETQQLLLLLDGLDEVKEENQNACVIALNTFQQQYGAEMVVCCRVHDYEILKHRLNFQKAILVRSLTLDQIQHYLDNTGTEMAALKTVLHQDVVLQELAQSPLMLNMMILVYQGKRSGDLPNLDLEAQRQYLLNSFIEKMLQRRGWGDRYSKEQVMRYLIWLSQKMVQESRSVFLIEDLQPSWLSTRLMQRLYRIIVMGIVGLVCGVIMGLFAKVLNYAIDPGLGMNIGVTSGILSGIAVGFLPKLNSKTSFGILSGLTSSLIFGLVCRLFSSFQPLNIMIFGLILGLILLRLNAQTIEPADTVQWSWPKGKQQFIVGLVWGLVVGGFLLIARFLLTVRWLLLLLPPGVGTRFCSNTLPEFLATLTGSVLVNFVCQEEKAINLTMLLGLLVLGLFVGFVISLVLGFKKIPRLESRTIPNHGIWKSARNAITLTIVCGSLAGVVTALVWMMYFFTPIPQTNLSKPITSQFIWWIHYGNTWFDGFMFSFSVAVLVGWLSGLAAGENSGLVVIQHIVLRAMLCKAGHIPWNYARFLNYAADRILLKKVGGGYIFIHRLLLEHFAQLCPTNRS